MRRHIERATLKLRRSSQLLEYRRLNWRSETNHRIRWEFEAFVRTARDAGFPFDLHIEQYDTPNEGVIQIRPAPTLTGTVNRKIDFDFNEDVFEIYKDTPVVEQGGELVASLCASGHVHFIARPRTSERAKANSPELILLGPLDPADVTVGLTQRALRRYLLLLQSSSLMGMEDALTFRERLAVIWLYFRDLRTRYELYRSLLTMRNEWAKLLAPGVIGFIVGYVTAAFSVIWKT